MWGCCSTEDCSHDAILPDAAVLEGEAPKQREYEVHQVLGKLDVEQLAGNVDVEVNFSGGDLGLSFDLTDKAMVVVKEVESGLITQWNELRDADMRVKAYDRLLEVNGKPGSQTELIEAVQAAKATKKTVQLRFRRPEERNAVIKKQEGKELGIILNYARSSIGLSVKGIDDGLVKDWNVAHASKELCILDRVCAVNGTPGVPEKLVELIKSADAPVLTWMHY